MTLSSSRRCHYTDEQTTMLWFSVIPVCHYGRSGILIWLTALMIEEWYFYGILAQNEVLILFPTQFIDFLRSIEGPMGTSLQIFVLGHWFWIHIRVFLRASKSSWLGLTLFQSLHKSWYEYGNYIFMFVLVRISVHFYKAHQLILLYS